MRAVHVDRYGRREYHWQDGDYTTCGRRLATLDIVEGDLELTSLPTDDGCAACEELARRPVHVPRSDVVVYATSARGRMYRTGPLYHGQRRRGGQQL